MTTAPGITAIVRISNCGSRFTAHIAGDRSLRSESITAGNTYTAMRATWNFIKKVNRSENLQHQNG